MRSLTIAALCAATLTLFASAARADDDEDEDDIPQPVSRTVVEPPSQPPPPVANPAAPPAETPPPPPANPPAPPAATLPPPQRPPKAPPPARPGYRSEFGFSLRMGAAETDRFLLGGSVGGASGPFMVGLSMDATVDVNGEGYHGQDSDHHDDWRTCVVRSDGRCTSRADAVLSTYFGLRHKTAPIFGGARLRVELAGELGWQWSFVDERRSDGFGGYVWSDGTRAFPIAGVRGQIGLTVFRNATFGLGAYARRAIGGKVCVTTDGGCTEVGGTAAGVYFFGGGDWGVGG